MTLQRYEPVRGYFPYPAVVSVTLCLFANNYAITSCFAYTGAMVVHLGIAPTRDEAGYYAGLLAASFMIGRGMTALVWGIMADRYGRRPVLLTCCCAMIVFQILFGCATSFAMALAARFFLGFFNGLVGTSKTAVAELVPGDDVKLQSKAMGILGGAVSFGQLIGPSVGGWLADPVQQYPDQYDKDSFLIDVPFVLPNIVGAVFALVATIAVYFFLPETRTVASSSNDDDDDDDDDRPVRTNCLPHSVQKVALSKPFVPQLVQKTGTTKAELGWSTTSLLYAVFILSALIRAGNERSFHHSLTHRSVHPMRTEAA